MGIRVERGEDMSSLLNPITGPQVGELAKVLHSRGIGSEGFQKLIENPRSIVRLVAIHICEECNGSGRTKTDFRSVEVKLCKHCHGSGLQYIRYDDKHSRGSWVPGIVTPGKNGWSESQVTLTGGGLIYCTNCGSSTVYNRVEKIGHYGCSTCHFNICDQLAWTTDPPSGEGWG